MEIDFEIMQRKNMDPLEVLLYMWMDTYQLPWTAKVLFEFDRLEEERATSSSTHAAFSFSCNVYQSVLLVIYLVYNCKKGVHV